MSAAVAGNRESRIPSGPSTRRAADLVRGGAEGTGRRRGLHPGVGDPFAEREGSQPGQPVWRRGVDHRDVPQAGQLDHGLEGRLADDAEFLAQVRGHLGERSGQVAGRHDGQEAVVEVVPELLLSGRRPAGFAGAGEPGDDPAQLGHGVAVLGAGLLERGPVRQAELTGDGRLGVVQGGELARGQAAFRLELQVPQAGAVGQCS